MTDPHALLQVADALADAAGRAILPFFRAGAAVTNKSADHFNPVTEADLAAEAAMRGLLARLRPDDAVVGEEMAATGGTSGVVWVLDPIDGTSAFMAGAASWGVLVAACVGGVPVAGVIDQPWIGERWTGAAGSASHVRGDRREALALSGTGPSILATTDPNLFTAMELAAFERLRGSMQVTRFGLDCMAYALLASGGVGLVVEAGLKPVDVAALVPVVEGAGGIITDWSGRPVRPLDPGFTGQVVAAAGPALHACALAAVSDAAREV